MGIKDMIQMDILALKNKLDGMLSSKFKKEIINNENCFILEGGSCFFIDVIKSFGKKGCLVLVVADNTEEMRKNCGEDGDLFYEEDFDSIEGMYDDIVETIEIVA